MRRSSALAALAAAGGLVVAGSAQAEVINKTGQEVPIAIPDAALPDGPNQTTEPASPYPSKITIDGAQPSIDSLTVRITGFSHEWPRDVDILLKGPQGQVAMLMSDVCGWTEIPADDARDFTFTSDDGAPELGTGEEAPMAEPPDLCASGAYKPTNSSFERINDWASDRFPPGAPQKSEDEEYPADLSVFEKTDPNGTWELYVADDAANSLGLIENWSLHITTPDPPADQQPGGQQGQQLNPSATAQQQGPVCLPEPLTKAPSSKKGKITLSATQFRIDQRIFAAGVLRANAIDAWLRDGIRTDDLCGGAITAAKLAPGITTGAGPATTPTPPSPRPVNVPKLKVKKGATFTATRAQLLINRRIAVALKERALALEARLDGRLTGGDLADGAVTQAKLASGLAITATPALAKPAPSTNVKGVDVKIGTVRRDVATVRTSQQIAADGIRILNRVRAQLQSGLKDTNFADGSIVTANLAPGLRK